MVWAQPALSFATYFEEHRKIPSGLDLNMRRDEKGPKPASLFFLRKASKGEASTDMWPLSNPRSFQLNFLKGDCACGGKWGER